MTSPGVATKSEHDPEVNRPSSGPFHNPSYPVRDHLLERATLEAALCTCEERVDSAHQRLASAGNESQLAALTRLFHQMQGARDQVAEMARRMPLETGELYHEDKEKFKEAVAACDRLWQRWETAGR